MAEKDDARWGDDGSLDSFVIDEMHPEADRPKFNKDGPEDPPKGPAEERAELDAANKAAEKR